MKLTDFEAILFDMDGTLVDSETLWRIAEQDTVKKHGATLEKHIQDQFTGIRVEKSAEIMRSTYGLEASVKTIVDDIEDSVKSLLKTVKDQTGAEAFIEAVVNLNLARAIVSNSTIGIIETTLAYKDWAKHFDLRLSAEHVKNAKPAPDIYLLAAEKLKVNIKNCLVIEDSLTGTKAGVSAGATCIAIPEHEDKSFYDLTPHVFKNFHEVLAALS